VSFVKASLYRPLGRWSAIATVLGQSFGDNSAAGAYATLYDDRFMAIAGTDGEQWRMTFGYVTAESGSAWRPAAEVLYADHTIGRAPGPRFLFVNATLGFRGGFLAHGPRLGRGLGPQGLVFANPLGALRPTWIRRNDLWEIGRLVNFRWARLTTADGMTANDVEAIVSPFEIADKMGWASNLFIGGFRSVLGKDSSSGVLFGFSGPIAMLRLSAFARHDFDSGDTEISVGIIDFF